MFLGRAALIERGARGYMPRPQAELERLLTRAYGTEFALDRVMPGFRVVAAALDQRNLYLAQIGALHLRLPDLPDTLARVSLETEDRLIKAGRGGDRLARSGWDPAEHPGAGVPPNPGWFAPTDGSQAPTQTAQSEEDERAPEEMIDPMAPLARHSGMQRSPPCARSSRRPAAVSPLGAIAMADALVLSLSCPDRLHERPSPHSVLG
jgi:hypothetical protein